MKYTIFCAYYQNVHNYSNLQKNEKIYQKPLTKLQLIHIFANANKS